MQFNKDDYIVIDNYSRATYGYLASDAEFANEEEIAEYISGIATERYKYDNYYKRIRNRMVGGATLSYVIWLTAIYCCANAIDVKLNFSDADIKELLDAVNDITLLLDKPGQSRVLKTKEFIKGAAEDVVDQFEDKIMEILKELDV